MSDFHDISRQKIPDTQEGMLELLGSLSDAELQELFEAHAELEKRLHDQGPQTNEELHDWLISELGIDVPQVAVCEGHQAPFDFLADLFFERIEAALGVANRGGAKTFLVAVLHWLNSRFKPGCESCTFGAIEAQSFRAYAHLKQWVYDKNGNRIPEVVSSLMKETIFTNGSKIEVLGTTAEAVNGPHPQKSHADEIELMRDDTWKESRNMTMSGRTRDGRIIIPQDIATSTRKGPSGRVQQLIDEIEKAIAEGYRPPRKLYLWCIKETAAQVKNCQVARPELPDLLKCPCHTHRRGEWEDGTSRTLDQICNGDFHRSRGWQPYQDLVKQFTENDRETFEVQQLCMKPEMKWHYVPQWREEKHCIRGFQPDPANGPIFMAVDWGGTNPHAVNWYQLLTVEIEVGTWVQNDPSSFTTKRLREGSIVCFDEIYVAEIGNEKLAEMVKDRELKYRNRWPHWRPFERYADPQGKAARMDWKANGLLTVWHTTREFDEHIKVIRDLFDDDLMYVDGVRCPMFCREIRAWRIDERTEKQLDDFNHCFHGETLIQTRDGLRMACDLNGETVEVLTQGGEYRSASWRSYGERDIYEVEFEDGEIVRVTDGHRWLVQRDGKGRKGTGQEWVATIDLLGRRVPTQAARWQIEDEDAYSRGVQNGLIYGDGTCYQCGKYAYSRMDQYGDENCALVEAFFPGRHGERRDSPHGVAIATKTCAPTLKQLPGDENRDYLRGFVAGLIASDGAVNKQGCCYISTSKLDDVNRIADICRSVGVVIAKVEHRDPPPTGYANGKPQVRIWITKASLDETILLKTSHRQNGLRVSRLAKPHTVKIVAVRQTGERAEVFCCEEPVTTTVVLGSGKISGQCMSNFRYAMANIKKVKRRATASSLPKARSIQRTSVSIRRDNAPMPPVGFKGRNDEWDAWRKSLGGPVTRAR